MISTLQAVPKFSAVAKEDPKQDWTGPLKTHTTIIEKFGRYPSRNKPLQRENTPEETEFLKEHAGF
jgi:uncharacterized protein (DUF924 family)